MSAVAKALARPPSYPAMFFGYELGSKTTIDQAKDKYVIHSKHDQAKFAELLDDFIAEFVLCKKCKMYAYNDSYFRINCLLQKSGNIYGH